jgi:hypothetical protein
MYTGTVDMDVKMKYSKQRSILCKEYSRFIERFLTNCNYYYYNLCCCSVSVKYNSKKHFSHKEGRVRRKMEMETETEKVT